MSTTHELAALEADFNTVLVPGSIKAAMKQAEAGSRDLWQIDPRKLKTIDGFNPRVHNAEYEAHIRDIHPASADTAARPNQGVAHI